MLQTQTVAERSQLSVLFIEDHPFFVELVKRMLDSSTVVVAETLATGLLKLAKQNYDIILLDLNLPDSEELETLTAVRGSSPDTPIIVVTATDDPETLISALRLGAQEVILKKALTPEILHTSMVSARERTNLQLTTAERYRNEHVEEFMTGLAHDLKNPIIGANRILELLAEQKLGPLTEQQSDVINLVKESNEAMLQMISHLLTVFRPGERTACESNEPETTDLTDLVNKFMSKIQIIAQDRKIDLECQLEKVDPISIDPISMARVIDNLVGNAIKFVPDGGKICVKVWQDDQTSVVLQVTDSGPGISIEEQGNLFGKYWRSKHARTPGTGLGLYLTQKIVQAHNGKISCETGEQFKGTTFTVEVPLAC